MSTEAKSKEAKKAIYDLIRAAETFLDDNPGRGQCLRPAVEGIDLCAALDALTDARCDEIKHLQEQVDQLQQRGSDLVKERQARLEHDADREKLLESLRADNDSLRVALGWANEAKDGLRELVDARRVDADGLRQRLDEAIAERDEYRRRKDEAYDERNRLVALVAKMALVQGWPAGVGRHQDVPGEAWDPEWRTLVVVETSAGQASWHFHDSHRHLLEGIPQIDVRWDGHDTPTKYARLHSLGLRTVAGAAPPLIELVPVPRSDA